MLKVPGYHLVCCREVRTIAPLVASYRPSCRLSRDLLRRGLLLDLRYRLILRQEDSDAQLQGNLPYIDSHMGGNNWANVNDLPGLKDLPAVSKTLAQQPKSNPTRNRVASCTSPSCYAKPTFHEDGLQYQRIHMFGDPKKRRSVDLLPRAPAYVRDRRWDTSFHPA